eukprot:scaffold56603_cov18-Tisochrysis_lutea.AAC.1
MDEQLLGLEERISSWKTCAWRAVHDASLLDCSLIRALVALPNNCVTLCNNKFLKRVVAEAALAAAMPTFAEATMAAIAYSVQAICVKPGRLDRNIKSEPLPFKVLPVSSVPYTGRTAI